MSLREDQIHLKLTPQTSVEVVLHKQNNFHRGAHRPASALIEQVKLILHQKEISDEDALFIYNTFKEDEVIKHLRDTTDTAAAKDDQFIFLFQNAKLTHHPKGSVIFKEGDKQDGKFYFVLTGEISLIKKDKESLLNASISSEHHPFIPIELIDAYSPSDYHSKSRETPQSVLHYKNRKSSFLVDVLGRNSPKTSTMKSTTNSLVHGQKFWQNLKKPMKPTSPVVVADLANSSKLKERKAILQQGSHETRDKNLPRSGSINSDRKKYRKSNTINIEGLTSQYGNLLDRVHEGGHCGEDTFEKKGKRFLTALATLNTDVMELDKKHIESFIEAFTAKREKMIDFLVKVIPAIDSRYAVQALENLLFSLEQKEANYNDYFMKEGETSDNVYILFEGTCQLSKTVLFNDAEKMKQPLEDCKNIYGLKQSSIENINICNVEKGAFIGEEILFNKSKQYEYNIQVTSSRAVFLTINKWKFSILPLGVNKGVRNLYQEKLAKNIRIFKTILQTKRLQYNPEHLEEIGPLIVSSKEKLSYRPNLHSKSPTSKNREFLVIEDFIKNTSSEAHLNASNETTTVHEKPKKQKNINTGKIELEGFSLERFIFDLHRYKDKKPDEDTATLEEGERTAGTIDKSSQGFESKTNLEEPIVQEKSQSDQKILTKALKNGFLAEHLSKKYAKQTEETTSKTIHSMLKQNTKEGNPQGEISLRLASHPAIMKVDQCYKIMKNIIKQDVVNRSNETDPIKQNNILGFVPDDFELETYRKKKNQKQKQIMLNRRLDEIKSLSPKRQYESPQTSQILLSTVAEKRYLKSRFKKRKKFPSFAALYQKSFSNNNSANVTAPTTPMSNKKPPAILTSSAKTPHPVSLVIPPSNFSSSIAQPPSPKSQLISPTSLMISPSSPGNTLPTSPGKTSANTPNLTSTLTIQNSARQMVVKFGPISPKHRRPYSGSITDITSTKFTHRPTSSYALSPVRPTMESLAENTIVKSFSRPSSSYALSPKRKVSMPDTQTFKSPSRPSSSYHHHHGSIRPLSGISILTEGFALQLGSMNNTGPTNESRSEIPELIDPQPVQTQSQPQMKKVVVGQLLSGSIHKNNNAPVSPVRRKGSIPKRVGGFTSKSFLNVKSNESLFEKL